MSLFRQKKTKLIFSYTYDFLQLQIIRSCTNEYHVHPEKANQTELSGRKLDDAKLTSTTKKTTRAPFVKNLFIGNFDHEVFKFIDIPNEDRIDMLSEMVSPIESYLQKVDSANIDKEARIPEETLQVLKEFGLYGLQIPMEYGGLGLKDIECARIAEVTALDGSISATLSAHQFLGVPGLLMAGTEEQKRKYLPKLASGEWTAALCVSEADDSHPFDAAAIHATAELTEDGKGFRLSGNKHLVFNGETADLLTVLARVKRDETAPSEEEDRLTLFLVERAFGGVRSGMQEERSGLRGADVTQIHFDGTLVPAENVLGSVGDGYKLMLKILDFGRTSAGTSCAAILKDLSKSMLKYTRSRGHLGHPLVDYSTVRRRMAQALVDLYAMESMAYLTAGLIDNNEGQDCTVESAIVKVFSTEKVMEHLNNCVQTFGGQSFLMGHPLHGVLRDSRLARVYDANNDILRLYIGLSGLELAGKEIQDLVEKLRNPLLYPYFTMQKVFKSMWRYDPKLDRALHNSVHPALTEAVDRLEYCTKLFLCATEDILGREGSSVIHPSKQLNIKRMADCAIDIYAMTAVIGRASRAKFLNFENDSREIDLACHFVFDARERVMNNVDVVCSYTDNTGLIFKKLSDSILHKKGYPIESALTRTFW